MIADPLGSAKLRGCWSEGRDGCYAVSRALNAAFGGGKTRARRASVLRLETSRSSAFGSAMPGEPAGDCRSSPAPRISAPPLLALAHKTRIPLSDLIEAIREVAGEARDIIGRASSEARRAKKRKKPPWSGRKPGK